ncbi:thioredoxin family protein [Vibrio brasiliensis]|uniref:protein-disulfide reductase DsbD family protein n=1 Tax=Vibrio brasiliensis TaxID=170652 RepID=UPI001EFE27F3|nr:protein-disulfide reductase DsbD domain-containing protein [Vibrio brasiliensis]MCG9752872.1 thioredoxin family protein [Vibrio brasiliensis]MCG9782739.1 thioredoxin family protein [Vibrio brasiliensis]
MNNKTLYALRTILGLWLLVASVLFSATSNAEVDTGWMTKPEHPPVKTRFVVTGQVNQAEKTVEGFLQVELDDDWKTYWRSPGEGGVAPSISWENSVNLQSVEWHWPYPQQFNLLGIHTLGYKSATVIPMTLHIKDFNQPVKLDADLTLSSCTTICVLTDYPFSLTFVPSELEVSESAMFTHAQAISQVPKSSPLIEQQNAIWDPNSNQLQVTLTKSLGWSSPELIVDSRNEAISDYSYQLKSVGVDGSKLVALFDVSTWLGEIDLSGQSVDVTVKDNDFVAEQSTAVSTGAISTVSGGFSLIEMVGFALLGGLILNVMPCVLPVLGMKLSGVIHAQGLERSKVRLQFIASSAGIITSFWLLAAFLLILKMSGNAIGWGIQFQSPWFIGFMVAVTALFGANMLGLFEFRLSANTNTWLASKGDDSYAGHYFQGMFATLLATPCSAPFLGTAVAFALAASALEMILIFTALALGMALPWLVVATFPGVAAYLPKPGAWMNKVKLLFGAMMLITSVWLLYLLTNHLPPFWVVVIAVVILVALLAKTKRVYGDKALAISGGASLILLVGALVGGSVTAKHWSTPLPEDLAWRPLSDEIITNSVAQGKTVFVNVTADWCVTCKANKIGVILQDPVYSALNHSKVVPVQGDWTHPDGAVTDYLRANGRFGVPFNIVYGPSAPQGIALPVILTSDMVMSALEQASGERS